MSNSRNINDKVIKRLYANSGGVCTMRGCGRKLFPMNNGYNSSEVAHIEGVNPGSLRYNVSLTSEQINDYDNLIILCPTHHSEIDAKENISLYSVESLKSMKNEHEDKVELARSTSNVVHKPFDLSDINTKDIKKEYRLWSEKEIKESEIASAIDDILRQNQYTRYILFNILNQCIKNDKTQINMQLILNESGIDFDNMVFQVKILSDLMFIKDEKYVGGMESFIPTEDGDTLLVDNNYQFKLVNGDWYIKNRARIIMSIYFYFGDNLSRFYDFLVNGYLDLLKKEI